VRIKVYINVDDPVLLAGVEPSHCDGVGLTRTEFLFRAGDQPDEETQLRAYAALVDWAGGRPVTIRTLDAGGDKPIPGLTPEGESNPFLGVRGLRLSLARPDVFTVQLRALARAAIRGPLRVMVPMVSVPDELEQARALMEQAVEALRREGREARMPVFGMMVEVPAAALCVQDFAADFFSIGTNDLIQYTMAVSRDAQGLGHLYDARNPAVLSLIERVARHGAAAGCEVSVCGNMAGEVEVLGALLAAGVRALSVPPAALASVKAAVGRLRVAPPAERPRATVAAHR
jgi:phosphotransferase system enzyme I (PtsI)